MCGQSDRGGGFNRSGWVRWARIFRRVRRVLWVGGSKGWVDRKEAGWLGGRVETCVSSLVSCGSVRSVWAVGAARERGGRGGGKRRGVGVVGRGRGGGGTRAARHPARGRWDGPGLPSGAAVAGREEWGEAWAAAVGGRSAGGSPSSLPSPSRGAAAHPISLVDVAPLVDQSPHRRNVASLCRIMQSAHPRPLELPSPAGVACGGRAARRHHLVGWRWRALQSVGSSDQHHSGEGRPPTPPTLFCACKVWPSSAGWP